MEVNNMVIAVFSIFLAILFTVNMINNYEQAAARVDAKKSYLEIDANNLNISNIDPKKSTYLKTDSEMYSHLVNNMTVNSNETWVDFNETIWNKTTFGKYGWTTLHVYSANYPTDPTAEDIEKIKLFLYLFGYFFPCKVCGHHFIEMLNKNPVNATSRTDLMFYLCNLHNKVNERIHKEIFDCKANLYKTYGGDCGCDKDDTTTNDTISDNNN